MAERLLSPEILALMASQVVEPVVFMFADFPSGARRLWTGLGNYTDGDANIWEGVGGLVGLESIPESIDSGAQGINVTLNGLNDTLINSVINEQYQGRQAEIRLGFWDRNLGTVVQTDEPIWKGTLDTDDITKGKDGTSLIIKCEHRMVDILRKREWRYTDQDQKNLYPDEVDTGLSHIEKIQDLTLPWGRAAK
jgi:hypothetical protein